MGALDMSVRRFGRLVLGTFFDQIETKGLENFPKNDPVLVVANHPNSLIDGALLASYLPRYSKMIAASTLWNHKALTPLLSAAGVIPVFRRHEVGSATCNNQGAFEASTKVLAGHGVLSIFPEGISHDDTGLRPIKKGAARIALSAISNPEAATLKIVPVAITYENKTQFRSRACLHIGEPIDPSEYANQAKDSVTELTQAIRVGLESALAQSHNSNPIYQIWRKANHTPLEREQTMLGGKSLPKSDFRSPSFRKWLSKVSRGTAAPSNWIPWFLSRFAARGHDIDKRATWSIFSALIIFPVYWFVFALAASALASALSDSFAEHARIVGIACFLSGPILGFLAARMWEWRTPTENHAMHISKTGCAGCSDSCALRKGD